MEPAVRGRAKRLLYWFRTPPGVRVGRAPIDETAIRLLEQHNPDVEFDWTRILKAPPPAEGQGRRDSRDTRDRDQRGRRESRSVQRPRSGGGPPAAPPPARSRAAEERPPAVDPAAQAVERAEQTDPGHTVDYPENAAHVGQTAEYSPDVDLADQATEPAEQLDHAGPAAEYMDRVGQAAEHAELAEYTVEVAQHVAPHAREAEDVEQRAPDTLDDPESAADLRDAEAAEVPGVRSDDVGSASYVRLGAEGLGRLRARYAEVMTRIAERPLDEAAREELKQRAERLNPDGWVTADEVTAALEQYETVFEGLRGVVGRHPRNRQRGRR